MHQHHEVRIDASSDYVWAVLSDVARWPDWTPAVREVSTFDGGPLVVGGGVRLRTRHLPDQSWRVAEVRATRGFTWVGESTGSSSRLRVRLARAEAAGGRPAGTVVVLELDRSGWVGAVVDRVTGTTTSARLDEIAAALRARCEAGQGSARVPPSPGSPA